MGEKIQMSMIDVLKLIERSIEIGNVQNAQVIIANAIKQLESKTKQAEEDPNTIES